MYKRQTGTFVEAILKLESVRKVTLVELNEALIINLSKIEKFQSLLSNPRLTIVIDDGRRFLLNSEEQFDAVLLDPLPSATAYSNNLYSQEFLALVSHQ